jgi:non-specific serine/threonine protein kinase
MIGTRIGHYLIESELGAGGMGVVYRAFDTKLERPVAIKVFAALSETPKSRRRLLHEARSASALNHPNVCTIYEVGESNDAPYLVMEFIEGRPLSRVIPSDGLPAEAVARYGAEIAAALAHAHSRGVVHRDLKCLNVMVTPDGHPKVLDFGLALREAPAATNAETVVDTKAPSRGFDGMAGTVAYMSPEALRGEPVDRRADIWALGVVLYEMASARLPFLGQTDFELCGRILHEAPAPLPDRVPAALRAIVHRCLAKDPSQRYQDAVEVRAALETMRPEAAVSSARLASGPVSFHERPGLLVLPFANVANDPETDYFADGLTEEIIADLSNVRHLRVISSTSSRQLKATARSLADLAAAMRVQYVLEGSVRRSGPTIRITAKLVEAATDSPVWGQKYTGALDDVFTIQETLSRAIVQALRVVLTAEEDERLKQHPIADVRAYEWYLRAKQEMLRFTSDGLDRAIEYLEKAAAIVGENALLLAAMGEAYWQYVNSGISGDKTYLDKAEACSRRAIELDPESPHGHRVAGLARVHRGDMAGALAELRQVLQRTPNDPDSLLWGALLSSISGLMSTAHAWAARLADVDPITPFYQLMPASMLWMGGEYERAAAAFTAHRAAAADIPIMRFVYGQTLVAAGRADEGRRELEDLARALPDNTFGQLAAVFRHALDGERDRALSRLTPSLITSLESDPQYCWFLAQCYALLKDADAGIRWVEAARDLGFLNHELLAERDPFLEHLRTDPRYPALMADVERRRCALER